MPSRILAGSLGLSGDWDLGEDLWKDENDINLLWLSILTQGRVLSVVAATPGAPAEGDVHIFDDTHPTNPNDVAAYDEGAWHYKTPLPGWRLFNVDDDTFYQFDGAAWVADLVRMLGSNNLSELTDLGDARTNLGLIRLIPFFFTTHPTANELLAIYVAADDFTIPIDFDGTQVVQGPGGSNPGGDFTITIKHDGVTIGTILIHADGSVVLTSAAGASVFVGDVISVHAPAGVDALIMNWAFNILGVL